MSESRCSKDRLNKGDGRHSFVQQRHGCGNKVHVSVQRYSLRRPGPHNNQSLLPQYTTTLASDLVVILEVMKNHRHENHIDGAICKWKSFASCADITRLARLYL